MIYIHILHTDFYSFQNQQNTPFSIFSLFSFQQNKRHQPKKSRQTQNPNPKSFQIANLPPNGRRHLTRFCIAGCFPGVDVGPDAGPGTLGSSGRRGGCLRSRGVVSGYGAQLHRGEHRELERLGTGGEMPSVFLLRNRGLEVGLLDKKGGLILLCPTHVEKNNFAWNFETCVFFCLLGKGNMFFFVLENLGKVSEGVFWWVKVGELEEFDISNL